MPLSPMLYRPGVLPYPTTVSERDEEELRDSLLDFAPVFRLQSMPFSDNWGLRGGRHVSFVAPQIKESVWSDGAALLSDVIAHSSRFSCARSGLWRSVYRIVLPHPIL